MRYSVQRVVSKASLGDISELILYLHLIALGGNYFDLVSFQKPQRNFELCSFYYRFVNLYHCIINKKFHHFPVK